MDLPPAGRAKTPAISPEVEKAISTDELLPGKAAGDSPEHESSDESAEELDPSDRLEAFTTTVRDQDDLEREIAKQADEVLTAQNDDYDLRRIEKVEAALKKLEGQKSKLQRRLAAGLAASTKSTVLAQIEDLDNKRNSLDQDISELLQRIESRKISAEETGNAPAETGPTRQGNESRHDFLVRTGKITPFSKNGKPSFRTTSDLQEALAFAEDVSGSENDSDAEQLAELSKGGMSHQNLRRPGFEAEEVKFDPLTTRVVKRRKLSTTVTPDSVNTSTEQAGPATWKPASSTAPSTVNDEDEYNDSDGSYFSEDDMPTTVAPKKRSRAQIAAEEAAEQEENENVDDGNETFYQARLRRWTKRRSHARLQAAKKVELTEPTDSASDETGPSASSIPTVPADGDEWLQPHPTIASVPLADDIRIPGDIYPALFDYQKTGVKWLSELYSQETGGIVGDEMGLGKTIQIISFLAGLHHSGKLTKPILVVAPATVLRQWVSEFHRWWPPLRVSILHTSGSGMLNVKSEEQLEDRLVNGSARGGSKATKSHRQAAAIVNRVEKKGHVLVTTYAGLQSYSDLLIPRLWEYAILDEGHKIRNPNTSITIHCKELRTVNRIILSGTPIQNNLTELWSLFDYISPMRLGTLLDFRNQFEFPIKQGGYASASALQIRTATKCAEILKDSISPYLLQRFKMDVAADLPKKVEQVLFCKLTKHQRRAYEKFLGSTEITAIINGRRNVLFGVDILRKICNHPDLVDREVLLRDKKYDYGNASKSGKMQVVKALLETWKNEGHKTLLFCQTRIMLDIIEKYLRGMEDVSYRRMDGNTPIKERQSLVDEFNTTPDIHVFLLTTKVGGLGVNLTGADRVLIYDPDWNPSTDIQARERAWRLGQKKQVTIYRLMTAGTIEEKIYHRQVFKQLLSNKVMRDPTQGQTFHQQGLHELFTLQTEGQDTETGQLFNGSERTFPSHNNVNASENPTGSDAFDPDAPFPSVEIPVQSIKGISSVEVFEDETTDPNPVPSISSPKSKENGDSEETNAKSNSDDRIMDALFARSGVQSALEHDQIIKGRRVIAPDTRLIEKEAKRIAAEAAAGLKKAAEAAKTVPIGTVTWTGEAGSAGRPTATGRGGGGAQSSASVIEGIRDSFRVNAGYRRLGRVRDPEAKDFVGLIRDYLASHGGMVVSQMLVNHFNHLIDTEQQQIEFTSSLKQIATLSKRGSMRGRWSLKDEYR
ncbi:MAG: hypothetical protein M1814_005917 [Vezdaea aestivalis]|nr:MAG: hypothetical protein M1814_005917 [Vezdaea aestivalis]